MNLTREPAAWRGFVGTILAALASVGIVSSDQVSTSSGFADAILAVAIPLIPLVTALWTRSKVTPVAAPNLTGGK